MNDMAWIENVIMCLHVYSDAPGSLTCEYCKPKRDLIASQLAAAEERGRQMALRGKESKCESTPHASSATADASASLANGSGVRRWLAILQSLVSRAILADVVQQIEAELDQAEERGRRGGVEEAQLGTCRVYRHGCADGRAIESHMSDRWREYALPHPKRENCLEWVALAPRDSGKDSATAADPYDRFAKDDEP